MVWRWWWMGEICASWCDCPTCPAKLRRPSIRERCCASQMSMTKWNCGSFRAYVRGCLKLGCASMRVGASGPGRIRPLGEWPGLVIRLASCTVRLYFRISLSARAERKSKQKEKKTYIGNNVMYKTGLYVVLIMGQVFPTRNYYGTTNGLSRGNEPLNAFLDRSRWLELL